MSPSLSIVPFDKDPLTQTPLTNGNLEINLEYLFAFLKKYPSIKFFYGDGFEGLPTYGPFDKVIITAAAPFIPPKLLEQMKTGGTMVVPVDEGEHQRMLRITKMPDGSVKEEAFSHFSFVPMLGGKNN